MSDAITLALAGVAGLLAGAVFFGGLWWTVRRGVSSKQPALWFFGSLMLRMSVALAVFYFASGGHWERLVSCLVGFVAASLVITRWTWSTGEGSSPSPKEAGHAPHSG